MKANGTRIEVLPLPTTPAPSAPDTGGRFAKPMEPLVGIVPCLGPATKQVRRLMITLRPLLSSPRKRGPSWGLRPRFRGDDNRVSRSVHQMIRLFGLEPLAHDAPKTFLRGPPWPSHCLR